MKVTTVAEVLALEKSVSKDDCVLTGRTSHQARKLYLAKWKLTPEQAKGHDVHHLCNSGWACLNIDHLVLMDTSEHMRMHAFGNQRSKGHTLTAEQRKKLSDINKGNAFFKGKTHTDATKRRLSLANRGKVLSEEHRRKMSLSQQIRWAKKRGDLLTAAILQHERDML